MNTQPLSIHHIRALASIFKFAMGQRVPAQPTTAIRLLVGLLLATGTSNVASAYTMSTNDDTIIIMEATEEEFEWLELILSPAYRVKYFNAEKFRSRGPLSSGISSSVNLYAAIFEPNPEGLEWDLVYGLTNSELQYAANSLGEDWEMMQAEVTSTGDLYTSGAFYLAYRRPGPRWILQVDVQHHLVDGGVPPEFNVVSRTFRLSPSDQALLTTTLYKEDGTDTIVGTPMSIEDFIEFEATKRAEGYRVTSVEVMQYLHAFEHHVPWGPEGIRPFYLPVLKRSSYLENTTQKWSLRRPQVIASLQSDQLQSMTPQWIALAHHYGHNAVVGYNDWVPEIEHETYYFCGFRERPYWNYGASTQHAFIPEKRAVPRDPKGSSPAPSFQVK